MRQPYRILIVLACLTLSFSAGIRAQTTFTPCSAGLNWIGDSLIGTAYRYDTIGMNSGAVGANAVWNYTTRTVDSTYAVGHHYLNPASTPYASSFPTANWCDYSKQDSTYTYELVSADSAFAVGNKSYRECSAPVWTPQLIQVCPTTFNKTWPEKYYANICVTSGTAHDYRKGNFYYDAFGKLELPHDTFPNTARTKEVVTMTDTTTGLPTYGTEIVTIHDTLFLWYNVAVNPPVPVFSYIDLHASVYLPAIPYTGYKRSKASYYYKYTHTPAIATGLPEPESESKTWKIYPSPFLEAATVEFSSGDKHFIEMMSITGKVLEHVECQGPQYILQRNKIPAGIYFFRVFDSEGKFIGASKLVAR
jgi:hypothetical protein